MRQPFRKFIIFYADPGIGLPWIGKRGFTLCYYRLRSRGFGLWVERPKHLRPRLHIGIWWVYYFEVFNHCTPIGEDRLPHKVLK